MVKHTLKIFRCSHHKLFNVCLAIERINFPSDPVKQNILTKIITILTGNKDVIGHCRISDGQKLTATNIHHKNIRTF